MHTDPHTGLTMTTKPMSMSITERGVDLHCPVCDTVLVKVRRMPHGRIAVDTWTSESFAVEPFLMRSLSQAVAKYQGKWQDAAEKFGETSLRAAHNCRPQPTYSLVWSDEIGDVIPVRN